MRAILTALCLSAAMPAAAEMIVSDGFARASGASAKAGAVFFTLENTGRNDDRLIAAQTSAATRVELHTHIMENGIARMRQIEGGIEIPAGGSHVLERGGDHVMLMGLTGPLEDGAQVTVTLDFVTAPDLTITVPINNSPTAGVGHSHSHSHSHSN